MKKVIVLLSFTLITLLTSNNIFAEDNTDSSIKNSTWATMSWSMNKEWRKEFRDNMEKLREDKKNEINNNKDEIKNNREDLKNNKKELNPIIKWLDDATKEKVKVLQDQFKKDMDALKEQYKDKIDETSKKEFITKSEDLRKKHLDDMTILLWNSEDAKKIIEARKEIISKNSDLRQSNQDIKKNFRQEKSKLIEEYKTSFITKLANSLDNIDIEKLQVISTRIEKMINNTENRKDLTVEVKDKLLSQLFALKEIIQDKINVKTTTSDVINIDALIK